MTESIAIAVNPGDPSTLRRITIDVPPPTSTQVLIDVMSCGVCGTDREIIAGHIGGPPAGSDALILGHEMLGRVNATGSQVTGISVGDLVTATVRRPDGCPLRQAGQPDMCLWNEYTEHGIQGRHGFLCQRVLVDQEWVVTLPSHLERTGMLVEPLSVVEKAVRQVALIQERLAIWEPSAAVVLGAGPIGILATLVLRSMDIAVYTLARTPAPNPAASAIKRSGAHYISTREISLDALKKSMPPIDIVVESTGAGAMSYQAVTLLGRNGVAALLSVSGGGGEIGVDADAINTTLVRGNGAMIGSVNAGREDWDTAVRHLDRFEEMWPGLAESLITTRIPYDGDLTLIISGGSGIKTVVDFT